MMDTLGSNMGVAKFDRLYSTLAKIPEMTCSHGTPFSSHQMLWPHLTQRVQVTLSALSRREPSTVSVVCLGRSVPLIMHGDEGGTWDQHIAEINGGEGESVTRTWQDDCPFDETNEWTLPRSKTI